MAKKNNTNPPKKDKWGRPEGSKYYSFNPETKKYEDEAKAKDYYGRKKDPVRYAIDKALTGEYQGKRASIEQAVGNLVGQPVKKAKYLDLQKKGGSVINGKQLRRQSSTKGLRTSRKHK